MASNDVLVVRPGEGQQVSVGDLGMEFMVRMDDTPSQVALHEWTLPPRGLGAPPHIHRSEDEVFYVLEGDLTVMEDDAITSARPGDYVVLPRGRLHTFWNAGDTPARMLVVLTPGQLEAYFVAANALIASGNGADPAQVIGLAEQYGLELRMDLLPVLMAEHGLETGLPMPPEQG
ncbi:MAG: cupin domain-containing protein [Chloroflexi bacterium]|nr:cupin domain-containing protein [Chloroflexota bacterium]